MRIAILISLALAFGVAAQAGADPYQEGRDLYKAGKYSEAAARFEEATRQDPKNAKAWWQLNFAYNKLSRYGDALRAVETAGKLDPTHSFASDPGKYEETLQRLSRKVRGGRGSAPSSGAPEPAIGPLTGPDGTMSRQMNGRGIFVQAGASVDVDRLSAVMRELDPTKVRFLVFSSRAGSAALSREADRVRRYLGIGDGYVIACSRGGVAASSTALKPATLRELTRRVAPQMEAGDYTGALERLARDLVSTRRRRTQTTRTTGVAVLGGVAGIALLWVIGRRMRSARSMKARRSMLEQRKAEVISQMNYLDDSAGAVPAAAASAARQARLDAGAKLDEGARLMAKARNEYDLSRAGDLLAEAAAYAQRGRATVEAALSGKPIPASAGRGVPPVYGAAASRTGRGTDWSAVPEDERGVCFFCSRPSLLSELRPVSLQIDGVEQRVLACGEDYSAMKEGRPPQIRAFERDGRQVPWYADEAYDPYRDYYERGYDDRSLMRDFVMMQMIDRAYWTWDRPTWGWGGGHGRDWDGYAFWPEHHHYRDYSVERAAAGSDFDNDYGRDAAGADFLDTGRGDAGSDTSGGSDFLGGDES